jgi:integrase/recombinase XerD
MKSTAIAKVENADIERRPGSISDQWSVYLAREVRAGQMSAATAATYRRGLRRFMDWGDGNPAAATDGAIKEWLAYLRTEKNSRGEQNTQNAISVWFAGVRSFFAWAVSERLFTADPTQGIKRGKRTGTAQRHKRDLLTDDEMIRILNSSLSVRDRALVHLLAYTGARGVELNRANIEDIQTEGGELVLSVQGKGRIEKDERVVIAHPDAKDAIYAYLAERKVSKGPLFVSESNRSDGERLTSRAMRHIVKKVLTDAGITSANKTTHSFRHSAITNAIRNGASLLDTQAMARHASSATTQVYYHNLQRIENAAEKRIDYRKG